MDNLLKSVIGSLEVKENMSKVMMLGMGRRMGLSHLLVKGKWSVLWNLSSLDVVNE